LLLLLSKTHLGVDVFLLVLELFEFIFFLFLTLVVNTISFLLLFNNKVLDLLADNLFNLKALVELRDFVTKAHLFLGLNTFLTRQLSINLPLLELSDQFPLRLLLVPSSLLVHDLVTALLGLFGEFVLLLLELEVDLLNFFIEILFLELKLVELLLVLKSFLRLNPEVLEGLAFTHFLHKVVDVDFHVFLILFNQRLVSTNIWIILQLPAEFTR
jgi:hypothetical protein